MNKKILPFIFIVAYSFLNAQKIFTIAGNYTQGYSGDGSAGWQASLNSPIGVAVDAQGNVYISDTQNNRIRKVSPTGIITTIAGTGVGGFSGDGGPATAAKIYQPCGIAIDTAGNIYFADRFNHRIRKIDKSGIISTKAGRGTAGFSGDAGPADSAQMSSPGGVAVDRAGNIYIADTNNDRVRKVGLNDTIKTVVGGGSFTQENLISTTAALATPWDVAVDTLGNIYVTDSNNNRVRKANTSGFINTIAGNGVYGFGGDGGAATAAQFRMPYGVELDAAQNIYISDTHNNRVRKIGSNGKVNTIAGNGVQGFGGDGGLATSAVMDGPTSCVVDASGDFYIADDGNHRVRKVCQSNCLAGIAYYEEHANLFLLYPNPNNGVFNLQLGGIEKVKFTLTNILGSVVLEKEVYDGHNSVQTIDLAKGIYQFTLSENNSVFKTGKVVVE